MTTKQLIEVLRDYIGDLQRIEAERTERNIAFNPTHAAERRAMQSAYNAALMEVSTKLTQLNKRIGQGL